MRCQQLTPPRNPKQEHGCAPHILGVFRPDSNAGGSQASSSRPKTLRFCEHRLQHLLYLTVDQRQQYAEQLVLKGFLL